MSSKRYFEALSEAEDAPLSPRDSQTQSASKSTPSEAPASKKPRLADVDQSLTTLHVTNLSPSVDTPALASHFSNCGTLKSCFVVCEKNNGPSRGFGYVSFGDGKQAEQALKKLNGSLLAQGKISVGWAKRRQREGEGPTVTVTAKDVSKLDQQHADRKAARKAQAFHPATEDTDARLVVCVRGLNQALSPEADQEDAESLRKAMYKKVKKLAATIDKSVGTEDAQMQVKYPVEEIAHIVCPTVRVATLLGPKLNDHIFKARLLTAYVLGAHRSLDMKGRSAGGRLVLRNLPFTTTIPDLYALFSPFGLIHSVDLPTDDKGKARGFGFVWFFKKDDAQKAMGKLNGVVVHGARSEWSDRIKRGGEAKKQTRLRKKREEFFNEKEQNGEEAVATTTTTAVGRAMAVDWAISKDKFEASEQKVEEKEEEATQDDADEEDEEDEDEEEDDDDDEEGTPVPADLERDESDDDESVEEDPKTDDFPTLFIRNIQFESTSADLHALFKHFGPVKYATIVTDNVTGRSRGTGFVAFYTREAADAVLKLAETVAATEPQQKPVNNPFAAPSLIVADPSSSAASKITLHGRVLNINSALSKGKADSLRDANDKAKKPKDRRNLYLLHEGHFAESELERMHLDNADAEARTASYDSRKGLLRTNPSLYLSRCRLSIRQIPTYVTDVVLRRLARYALKAFDEEVKAGSRKDLTQEERSQRDESDGLGVVAQRKPKMKKDGTVLPPARVQQAKVLRQTDKLEPLTGLGKSKGYGFVELASHADALRVLRYVNANATVGKLLKEWWVDELQKSLPKVKDEERKKRLEEVIKEESQSKSGNKLKRTLIVEFSIENIQTVRRREEKASKSREIAHKRKAQADEEVAAPSGAQRRLQKAADAKSKKTAAQNTRRAEAGSSRVGGGGQGQRPIGNVIQRKRKEKKARHAGKRA